MSGLSMNHYLVDAAGKGILLSRSPSATRFYGAAHADLLRRAVEGSKTVVFATGPHAVLTDRMFAELSRAGATWSVVDDDGSAFDARTGRRLRTPETGAVPELWEHETHPTFLRSDAGTCHSRLRVLVSRRHRHRGEADLGGDLESLAVALTGTAPAGWGWHEPSGMRWDRTELTMLLGHDESRPTVVVTGTASGRRLAGSIRLTPARHGLDEHTEVLADLGPADDVVAVARRRDRALAAATSSGPGLLSVLAMLEHGRPDLCHAARAWSMQTPSPVALLLGATAMKELGAAEPELASDGFVGIGEPRTRAAVLDLRHDDAPTARARLRSAVARLDTGRLDAVAPALTEQLPVR